MLCKDDSKITDAQKKQLLRYVLEDGNRERFLTPQILWMKKYQLNLPSIRLCVQWGRQDKLIDVSMLENFKKMSNHEVIIYESCGPHRRKKFRQNLFLMQWIFFPINSWYLIAIVIKIDFYEENFYVAYSNVCVHHIRFTTLRKAVLNKAYTVNNLSPELNEIT